MERKLLSNWKVARLGIHNFCMKANCIKYSKVELEFHTYDGMDKNETTMYW
jgi:hypothetical protein